MSFKFNWGHGLTIALALFVIFISYFVYRSLADSRMNHTLVSEEYYKDELYFQDEIDRLENAANLEQDITTKKSKDGIAIYFPPSFDPTKINGTVVLQRASDKDLDYETELQLKSSAIFIPRKNLVRGLYNLKINWEYEGTPYQYKEKITY